MVKVLNQFKSFWEWRMNLVRNHPFYTAWSSFVKGMIIGGSDCLLVFRWFLELDNEENK